MIWNDASTSWQRINMKRIAIPLVLMLLTTPLFAEQEAVVVLQSTVTGNQEQPKVLYIVPWQHPDGPESLYRPMESLVDDVFKPLERVEFVRELNYREMLNESQTAAVQGQ